jgi:hypothetical protein
MEIATSERLQNLRRQLDYCGDNPADVQIRSNVEAEIRDILSGNETRTARKEPKDVEVRQLDNEAWLEDARRRLEGIL